MARKNDILSIYTKEVEQIKADGLFKGEAPFVSPQGAKVVMEDGRELLNMCANNYLGLGDNGLASVGTDMDDTLIDMLSKFVDDESELISVYYGEDIDENKAEELVYKIEEKFDGVDVELQYGGQPVYYYIVSVE